MPRRLLQTKKAKRARAYYKQNRAKILRRQKQRRKRGGNFNSLMSEFLGKKKQPNVRPPRQRRVRQLPAGLQPAKFHRPDINSPAIKRAMAIGRAMGAGAKAREDIAKQKAALEHYV